MGYQVLPKFERVVPDKGNAVVARKCPNLAELKRLN